MFQGFNNSTIEYFKALSLENSRASYKRNETLYLEGVKNPLEEMYIELYDYFGGIDPELVGNRRRCISSAYNDARFCKDAPIKEYFYLKFKLDRPDKKNAPGFFFDAAIEDYRYGLNIYNMDARGMEKIREHILNNKYYAEEMIERFNESGLLLLQGEKFKKTNYPDAGDILQGWLERKRISFYHEESMNESFFSRKMLEDMIAAYDSVKDVYEFIKESLINS